MWVQIPLLQICLLTVHIASGVGSNVLNTATVELYPTNLGAMAICISLMFGRLGSMVGSNVIALLLQNQHCEMTFYSSGLGLIGKDSIFHFNQIDNLYQYVHVLNRKFQLIFLFLVASMLAFFIPNIHQKVTKIVES